MLYKVLLIDDESWNIKGLSKLIDWESQGFTISGEAYNGAQALEMIQTLRPDLIMSDIKMPHLNGLELSAKLRELELSIEVVFISGFADFNFAQEAIRLESFDYLLKPVEEDTLINVLQRVKLKLEESHQRESFESTNSIVAKTIDYLHEHYQEKIKSSDLAQLFQLSEGYYLTLIKKHTNRTLGDILLDIRITKSQHLLKSTSLSIAEIGEAVGYHDYYYFTRVFKKVTGMTPSKFRKDL